MRVYLVRHGESVGNAGPNLQSNGEPLSDKGQEQAEHIGRRMAKLPIDKIYASTLERARATADVIARHVGLPVEHFDELIERQLPSAIVGLPKTDPAVLEIRRTIWDRTGEDWKYADEENFHDLKKRALACLELFKDSGTENLLVVTHGFILRVIVACAMFGDGLSPRDYVSIVPSLLSSNTGLTILEYRESFFEGRKPVRWNVLTWNDRADLADA